MVHRICISVSDEHMKLIDDMQLSPSGLFKQRMEDLKEESYNFNRKIDLLQASRDAMQKTIDDLNKKLEEHGILAEETTNK